jgi:PAS domain S-box-containing protein
LCVTRGVENTLTDPGLISILCVDDEPLLLEVIKKFFEREPGFSVKTCTNGKDALELLNSMDFDAILCDYGLPDIDGINLLREVRRQGLTALFIIITGKHRAQVAIDALNNGADYYVQKGGGVVQDIPQLVEFINERVGKIRENRALLENERIYHSIIECQSDLIARFSPQGEIYFVNNSFMNFIGMENNECLEINFFSLIPEEEHARIQEVLRDLTPEKPGILIEHEMRMDNGTYPILQWNYCAIFSPEEDIIGYQTSGREIVDRVQVTGSAPPKDENYAEPVSQAGPYDGAADSWNEFARTIDTLESPVLAINKAGIIIAWNKAMEQLTGFEAKAMMNKGNREYAIPFYGESRPMLVDYIVMSDKNKSIKLSGIKQTGNTFIGEMETVKIRGKLMYLWGRGTALHDESGALVAAIETITVAEKQEPSPFPGDSEKETYIGGLSSPTLKVTGESLRGAGTGGVSSSGRGYGIYATNRRLFVIQNPDFDLSKPKGIQYEPFGLDDLFGTKATIDNRPRSIGSIEKLMIYEISKGDLKSIELMNPRLLPGFLTLYNKTGDSFRMFIDHKTAFTQIEHLIKSFYPEILQLE